MRKTPTIKKLPNLNFKTPENINLAEMARKREKMNIKMNYSIEKLRQRMPQNCIN